MGVLRVPFQRPYPAQRSQLPPLTAAVAGQRGSLSLHLPFRAAVGAFIEDPVQAVRPEVLVDFQLLLTLPAEMVEGKSGVQSIGQLLHGFFMKLLPGVQERCLCAHRDGFSHF